MTYAGWGIFANVDIAQGVFVAEYKGELVMRSEGISREELYENEGQGSFLYFFDYGGKKYW